MRKIFLINILYALSFYPVIGQNLNSLDNKFGFNKFKLESSYELYKRNLSPTLNKSGEPLVGFDGVKYYDYTGNDVSMIFGVFIKKIGLGFFKNKLYTISVEFLSIGKNDENRLISGFKEMFGYQPTDNDKDREWVLKWETQKTYLQLEKYSCENLSDPCLLDLFLFSKKMRSAVNDSQF
jgi:hypothetical protein